MIHLPRPIYRICIASLFLPLTYCIVANPNDKSTLEIHSQLLDDDTENLTSTFFTITTTSTAGDGYSSTSQPLADLNFNLGSSSTTSTPTPTDISIDTDDEDPKCSDFDELELFRNPENCGEYFVACVRSLPEAASKSLQLISGNPVVLKEQYDVHKRSCQNGYLFDGIEKLCTVALNASCNESYETICFNETIFHVDPVQQSNFIECFNGTAKRTKCQPRGTIFDEEAQICVKPTPTSSTESSITLTDDDPKPEAFTFSLLRILVRFISSTKDTLSPWMETIKLHPNSTFKYLNENFSITNEDENDDILYAYNSSDHSSPDMNIIKMLKNSSETEFMEEEQDEIVVWTRNKAYLVLYYGVMAGLAIIVLLVWLVLALICSKICTCCNYDTDEDDDDEFYKQYAYNPNDKYMMTKM